MKQTHKYRPLFEALHRFTKKEPLSFHVPGHKNGQILAKASKKYYAPLLSIDLTELTGLDDLHAPQGVIKEAEQLATDFFQADQTFFLVGGSTVGNLAMILATCSSGDSVIVQRNSHKSIMNGLELSGANPIFITPEYDKNVQRYTAPSYETCKQAIETYPNAKAIVLTYPDYFGKTYELRSIIHLAHTYHIPVLVDEAHGVHFSLGKPFPPSALELGADVVVQSAHKMAPAMTMASFLHIKSTYISQKTLRYYLQMLQSSSPSYPLMASLDVARSFLATLSNEKLEKIVVSVEKLASQLRKSSYWEVLKSDDPLKLTLHVKEGLSGYDVASLFEREGIFPEMATHNQVLLIHGLDEFHHFKRMEKAIKRINEQLKNMPRHATINIEGIFQGVIHPLACSFQEMGTLKTKEIPFHESSGYVAAEPVIPYPPGIPLILKGERITNRHVQTIEQMMIQGATVQHHDIEKGILVFIYV